MNSSNILIGSNVYVTTKDSPWHDEDFISKIYDFDLLKRISIKSQIDIYIPKFDNSEKLKSQSIILNESVNCVYCKNDPCWGFVKAKNKYVSACLNNNCRLINECNPKYSVVDAVSWIPNKQEINRYGNPEQQCLYYLLLDDIVEDISENYKSNPSDFGLTYTPIGGFITENGIRKDESIKKESTRFDPISGRKLTIIGYKPLLYPSEDGIQEPIWGFVDNSYNKIEIYPNTKSYDFDKNESNEEEQKSNTHFNKNYSLKSSLKSIKLGDLKSHGYGNVLIVCSNIAEQNFILSYLIKIGLIFSDCGIIIRFSILGQSIEKKDYDFIYILDSVLEQDNYTLNEFWNEISHDKNITRLLLPPHRYAQYEYNKRKWWTSNNAVSFQIFWV